MSTQKSKLPKIGLTTPEGRVSFPNVFEMVKFETGEPAYTVNLVFDKNQDLTELKTAIKKMAGIAFPNIPLDRLSVPLRDGSDYSHVSGYGGDKVFIRAKNLYNMPQIIQKLNGENILITTPNEFYAGCYAKLKIHVYAYSTGTKGIGLILLNILKTRDGEPFGEAVETAEESFADEPSIKSSNKAESVFDDFSDVDKVESALDNSDVPETNFSRSSILD